LLFLCPFISPNPAACSPNWIFVPFPSVTQRTVWDSALRKCFHHWLSSQLSDSSLLITPRLTKHYYNYYYYYYYYHYHRRCRRRRCY
jgi:hypothetical protein